MRRTVGTKWISIIMTVALAAVLVCGGWNASAVYADSPVKIGQGVKGENGAKNNKPGDKSGKEVGISDWQYSLFGISPSHWEYVIRARDHELARKIAANMKAACENDRIGYDQNYPDRGTFYDEAKKKKWDISKVDRKCETTCTNAISVCLNAAGVKTPKYWMSDEVRDDLMATGLFDCYDTKDYYASDDKLLVGDILVNPKKHTAVVVESPNPFTYEVTYLDAGLENKTVSIEENKTVYFNYNNGEEPGTLLIEEDTDITDMEPEKKNYRFTGWVRSGKRAFTAQYAGERPLIRVESEKVLLENGAD